MDKLLGLNRSALVRVASVVLGVVCSLGHCERISIIGSGSGSGSSLAGKNYGLLERVPLPDQDGSN